MKPLIFFIGLLAVATCQMPLQDSVSDFDVDKFLEHWYGIATIPYLGLEIGCNQANFTLKEDGSIGFVFTYKTKLDASFKTTKGVLIADTKNSSKFKMKYDSMYQVFDFWVLKVDDNYTYAALGDPSRTYLWFISRSSTLDNASYQALLDFATKAEFPVEKLEKIDQNCGKFE